MTSQGHARTVFRRAIKRENLFVAEATARELGYVNLVEALDLMLPRRRLTRLCTDFWYRREILDALIPGEKAVGTIVTDLSLSQPQVSKHLRVLSEVGLVRYRAEGRRRLYRLEPAHLRPMHDWLAKYERA